ncbi:MAG: DUF952 domain-containing protein [Pyrinomonadaceae bacterium]
MAIIFHIAEREAWNQSQTNRSYRPEMFAVEGFIHCSTRGQVLGVANTRFRGRTDLLLLSIDTDRVGAEICYENLEGGEELFPHIYGELAHDAVTRVAEFKPGDDGSFRIVDC